ncbi:MAG TPA: hypothetical protein VHI78_13020 [Bacteroidales bacterium]|nr:hypothetical protein [Bacteroidales bacterium]
MSYRHTLEAAIESLHEIEDLVKRFPENGKIPSIDLDLALQKLRNLYELLLMMKGNELASVNEATPQSEPSAPKHDDAVFLVEESKKTTVTLTSSVEEVKTVKEEEKTEITHDKTDKSEKKSMTSKKSGIEVQTLGDQFKGRTTLLETLSSSFTHESEILAHSKPISDLMSAIALNDRFTFIRELFNNDKKAFESAIATLNNAGTYNNAYDYVSQQFGWDMEDDAVQLFLSIIRRKYVKGRNE